MDIKAVKTTATQTDADTLLVYLPQENEDFGEVTTAVDAVLDGHIRELVEAGEFSGKRGETVVLYPRGAMPAKRVIVVGLGKAEARGVEAVRQAAAIGVKKARDVKAVRVATVLAGMEADGLSASEAAQAIVEGALLGLYRYHGQKSSEQPADSLESLELLNDDESAVEAGIAAGRAFAAGTLTARELANLPANICTPEYMAGQASRIAGEVGLTVEILSRQQMQTLKMGALLAVAQGSETPPRFIILEHNADKREALETVVLVGKGVTFDTGGYSLKPKDGMIGMKGDMGGGAAVIGAMQAVALLDVPLHVVGLVPAADNMVSGKAYRPQDVITASNGKTIEIISTDAEGRLLLADALVYAQRYEPSAVVDIATLTGSCVVALGKAAAGLFSNHDGIREAVMAAGEATHERVWPLPIFAEYAKDLESQTADTKNSGGRWGGAGIAASFLSNFVNYPAWAHVDMAGMMADLPDNPYIPAGASGYGARLLAAFTQHWAGRSD